MPKPLAYFHAVHRFISGNDRGQNSDVQGIVSFYGGANLTTILKQSTPHGLSVRVPALDLLLCGQPDDVPGLAAPAFKWIDATRPCCSSTAIRTPKCP